MADCFKNADRSTKTKLVNSVVAKTEDGTYQIVTDNKQFREVFTRFKETTKTKKERGIIREEAEARLGGAAKLQQAIDKGSAYVEWADNMEYIIIKSFIKSETEGSRDAAGTSGSRAIKNKKEYSAFKMFLNGLGWKAQRTCYTQFTCKTTR